LYREGGYSSVTEMKRFVIFQVKIFTLIFAFEMENTDKMADKILWGKKAGNLEGITTELQRN
jgi:hypothetical protein